jgi:SAM-dependent methyltransferase
MEIDILKEKGRPYKIPDALRDELPEFFKKLGFKVGAEIGVLRGEFTEKLCRAGLKMYAIDPWEYYKNYKRHPQEEKMEDIMAEATKRLAPYDCTLIKKSSMEALEDFKDDSLDFVYIDGNHSIRYIVEDIYEWYRKVKPGGIIAGHDYVDLMNNPYGLMNCRVKSAVDLMTGIYNKDYYILGQNYGKRDKWRSWFFVR